MGSLFAQIQWQSEVISVGDLDQDRACTGLRRTSRWQSEVISVGDLDFVGGGTGVLVSVGWQSEVISVGDLDVWSKMSRSCLALGGSQR